MRSRSSSADAKRDRLAAMEHDPPPAPRERRHLVLLGFAIAAPPLLWSAQLLVLTAFANYACFPGDMLRTAPALPWLPALEFALDAIAIAVAIAAIVVALRLFRRARDNGTADPAARWHLDRLCFMALGGLLSGSGFLAAILFETIASVMVPPCG